MNNLPTMIFLICHGDTEGIFIQKLLELYLFFKYQELDLSTKNTSKPALRIMSNWNNGKNVTVNGYETDVQKHFFSKNNTYGIEDMEIKGENDILFISIIDINERDEKKEIRKYLIDEEGHKEILTNLLRKSKLIYVNENSIFDSVFIYFSNAIEDCLPGYDKKKDKKKAMHSWLKTKVNKLVGEDYSTVGVRKIFKNIDTERSNIMEVFNCLDNMYNDFTSKNSEDDKKDD